MKKTKYYPVILLLFMISGLIMTVNPAMSKTPKEGKFYFESMKASILEVIEENQKLINTKPDGSPKTENLKPENLYFKMYAMFKKIAGKDFKMGDIEGETDPEKIAPIMTMLLQAARDVIADSQQDINKEADGSVNLKKFIPAVFGRLTIDRFTQKTGVYMKQTTLGHNGFSARNPYNAPNEWEAQSIQEFLKPGWELNKGVGFMTDKEYQYVKPLYIKQGCLVCHGEPTGEKGPYGHPKEGYKVGDIRGGISISLPNS